MLIRTSHGPEKIRLHVAHDTLLPGARPEENTHLEQMDLSEVLAKFWPAWDGWTLDAIEQRGPYLLAAASHPAKGVGFSLMELPGGWDACDALVRANAVFFVHHTHGATRLDILDALDTVRREENFSSADAQALAYLSMSPAFLDDATQMMFGLGTYQDLLSEAGFYTAYQETLAVLDGQAIWQFEQMA